MITSAFDSVGSTFNINCFSVCHFIQRFQFFIILFFTIILIFGFICIFCPCDDNRESIKNFSFILDNWFNLISNQFKLLSRPTFWRMSELLQMTLVFSVKFIPILALFSGIRCRFFTGRTFILAL